MMRLIDARISSIEGSCAFAGCVISDSTSSARIHQINTKPHTIVTNRFGDPSDRMSWQQLFASNGGVPGLLITTLMWEG
jgi:hypothetical protein